MVSDFNYLSKVGKNIISLLITTVLFYLVLKVSFFYLPFLISFIISLFIEPAIKFFMNKLKWTRKISAVFVITFSFVLLVAFISWGAITLFNESGKLLEGADGYFENAKSLVNNISNNEFVMNKLPEDLRNKLKSSEDDYINSITNWIVQTLNKIREWIVRVPKLITSIFFAIGALYFICIDKIYMIDQVEHHLPDRWTKKLSIHIREIVKSIGNYLKAEGILVFISFIISLIGLTIFKIIGLNVQYPLIIALAICFVDALPILGSGTFMIPWGFIESIKGDFILAVSIILLWITMTVIRNIVEPRIISNKLGIHPVFTLISMYTGFKLIGVGGMIVGPIFLIIVKEIYTPFIDKGVFRSIFEEKN